MVYQSVFLWIFKIFAIVASKKKFENWQKQRIVSGDNVFWQTFKNWPSETTSGRRPCFLANQNEMSNFCEGPTSFLPRFVQFASVVLEMIKMWKVNRRMDDRRWLPSDGISWHWWRFSSGELKLTLYFDNLYF